MAKRPLHIGLVLQSTHSVSETFIRSKIKSLHDAGYRITLYAPRGNQAPFPDVEMRYAPVLTGNRFAVLLRSVLYLCQLSLFAPRAAFRLFKLNRKHGNSPAGSLMNVVINSHFLGSDPDWLHFEFATLVIRREFVAEAISANMAVSFRGYDFYLYPLKHPDCYKTLFQQRVRYQVLSQSMKQHLITQGISSASIHQITPATAVDFFTATQPLPEKNSFCTIARLHWVKGIPYILEALALLKADGYTFDYHLIGSGPEHERLRFLIHQLGLEQEVKLHGASDREQIRTLLNESSIYIQYSVFEGFCNAVIEAQAMGRICVVSDADGLVENIIPDNTGFVVPKRSPHALNEKLKTVIRLNPAQKNQMAHQAASHARNSYDVSRQHKLFLEFYTAHS